MNGRDKKLFLNVFDVVTVWAGDVHDTLHLETLLVLERIIKGSRCGDIGDNREAQLPRRKRRRIGRRYLVNRGLRADSRENGIFGIGRGQQ